MVMASCGDANAAWVSSANAETLCYELADEFFDLYDGYTTNGKVQDHELYQRTLRGSGSRMARRPPRSTRSLCKWTVPPAPKLGPEKAKRQ
jgi:hypothetical protein